MRRLLALAVLLIVWGGGANAQTPQYLCFWNGLACSAANGNLVSATNPLPVTGTLSLSGSTSNASSGVATSSTNVPTVAYNYGFNGTTWDQLQVDASKFLKVVVQATTSGGCLPYHLSGGTTASNNSSNIKPSPGNLCSIAVFNDGTGSATAVNYLKIYDSASAPTCSSATNIKHVIPIPVSATVGGLIWSIAINESYSNGIGFCVVSTGADTGNGNAQTGIYVEASYK